MCEVKIEPSGLRTIAEILDREDRKLAANAIREAADDWERLRAATVDADVGSDWRPIETAPKDGSGLLLACADWPHSTRLGKPIPVKVGGWHPAERYWQIFGASWVPTHWMPLPPTDDLNMDANVGSESAA